jgi:class 3 adenylate cyclase/tetratricopeptide (TPR) repeat protein
MSTPEQQIAQLQAAIAALEAQRSVLGDGVVEAGTTPMRAKLAALQAQIQPVQQRKLATVLFADVSGFTALSETIDPEVVAGIMNDLWALVDKAITNHGGHIDKHIGDAVMALWGAETAREDDPEMAVRGALAMQAGIDMFCTTHNVPLAMRIGVNTGPVLIGAVGTTGEFTAMGDAVNLASRLEHAAPVGGVLIAHDTYRHIRGIFDVQPQEPLVVKGKAEPVQTYVVQRAKPRAFRMATRGVEGIETRMVGRDSELHALQAAFTEMLACETRAVAIVGEAGVGKSRLLYEFDNWLELRPEHILYFKGRGTPNTQNVAYGLFRDMFSFRFAIYDSDSAAVALDKFRRGMTGVLEPDRADVAGHWLGFDFESSEAVRQLLGSSDFGVIARAHLTRYFRTLAASRPVVILMEDIHWADDPSLDLATHLAAAIPQAELLIIAVTRPSLFERHPGWGDSGFKRINVTPLSKEASRALVNEILQRVDEVPDPLRDVVIEAAEGNPFYVEEMVKMLIDQGVIEREVGHDEMGIRNDGGGGEDSSLDTPHLPLEARWRVRDDKLAALKVPPTLTGLLQARLDGLPRPEREALQRAAIVGRLFWDDAVADLSQTRREDLRPTLAAVCKRELIFLRERSAFADSSEYIFKHALLRDVAYETVLLKYRAEFHGRVARWMEAHAGERIGEYLGLIAEHSVQAGELDRAAEYQHRSGEHAMRTSAFRAARAAFERALALRERSGASAVESLPHYLKLGEVSIKLSDFGTAEHALGRALVLARESGDIHAQAEALPSLASVSSSVGRNEEAGQLLEEALALARQTGGKTLARALIALSTHEWQIGELDAAEQHATEVREMGQEWADFTLEANATQTLGIIAGLRKDFDASLRYFGLCLVLAQQTGNRYQEAVVESNIGATKQYAMDFRGAIVHYLASLEAGEEMGMLDRMAINAHNLADVYVNLGELAESHRYALLAIRLARQVGAIPVVLATLVPLADVMVGRGDIDRALALLGLAQHHPSTPKQKQIGIDDVLQSITMARVEMEDKLAAGAKLDFETVVQEILDGKW